MIISNTYSNYYNYVIANIHIITDSEQKKFLCWNPESFTGSYIYTYVLKYYHIARKFGEFGELSVILQTKTIQISSYNW